MAESHELSCQRIVELATEYLEGTLTPVDRARFEEHLDVCPHCAIYLQQMRTAIRALGRVHAGDLAPGGRAVLRLR